MFELIVQASFAAAHQLRGYEGKCENLHGHNWKVDVILAAPETGRLGMVLDFTDVKATVNAVLERLDHTFLNELDAFREVNPTTEHVARWVFQELGRQFPSGVQVKQVTAWESDHCGASYRED